MTKLFFTLFCSLFFFFSQAQARLFTSKDSLNMFCDKVMQTITERKFSEAIQLFRQRSVMDTTTINSIDKTLNEQMINLAPFYKKIVEYEFIDERAIKNSVVSRRYLLKFENYFLTFDFVLYNNRTGWTVSNFNYYDDPKQLF
jgi:hypothetical protein